MGCGQVTPPEDRSGEAKFFLGMCWETQRDRSEGLCVNRHQNWAFFLYLQHLVFLDGLLTKYEPARPCLASEIRNPACSGRHGPRQDWALLLQMAGEYVLSLSLSFPFWLTNNLASRCCPSFRKHAGPLLRVMFTTVLSCWSRHAQRVVACVTWGRPCWECVWSEVGLLHV